MNEPRGEQTPASPEYGLVRGTMPLEEVLDAYSFSRSAEKGEKEPLSNFLESVWALQREGFPSGLLYDYKQMQKLDFGKSNGGDFWADNKDFIELFNESLYQAHVEEVAMDASYFTEFFLEHPTLIRMGAPDGPRITGVDAEFEEKGRHYGETRVLAYTDTGEPEYMSRSTKLFVNLAALPKADQEKMRTYVEELGLPSIEE